jgi:hypothetical protein
VIIGGHPKPSVGVEEHSGHVKYSVNSFGVSSKSAGTVNRPANEPMRFFPTGVIAASLAAGSPALVMTISSPLATLRSNPAQQP